MACFCIWSTVGPMMNIDKNRASPIRTWFGGMDGVPSALRVRDSTTTILVNDVQSRRIAGAIPSTVTSRMICSTWLCWPGTLTVTLGSVGFRGELGPLGAMDPRGAVPAAARASVAGDHALAAGAVEGAAAVRVAASADAGRTRTAVPSSSAHPSRYPRRRPGDRLADRCRTG